MTVIEFGAKPLDVHIPFFKSRAKERCLFGAFGSGKTYALVDEAIQTMLEQPGIRGLASRKTSVELRDSLEPIFMERIPPELYDQCTITRTGGHYDKIVFPNGSEILFRGLDDWHKLRSLNIGFWMLDEANTIDEDTYMGVRARVRQIDLTKKAKELGYTTPIHNRKIFIATNPHGHDWVWRRFVSDKREPNTEYFKSTSLDNPYLPLDYVQSLLEMPDDWVKRYVLCSFEDFSGAIYKEWDYNKHVVPYPKIDHNTVWWMGMDPGTESPTAGLWVVVDHYNKTMTGIAEYQEAGLSADVHAQKWRAIEARHKMKVRTRIADPVVTTRDRGTTNQLSDQYRRLGFSFQLGAKRYDDRIPALGQLIKQGRFRLTKDCPQTFEQIQNYQWEEVSTAMRNRGMEHSDRPLKTNDHLVDCAQYLAGKFIVPKKHIEPPPPKTFNDEIWDAVRRQQRRKRRATMR